MDFTKYLVENAYVLIPVLYILGNILKDLKFIADKYIPVLLLGLGILLSCTWLGFSTASVIQGILITGITVYSNQMVKQLFKNDTSIANLTVQSINQAIETVKTEASTTAINNTISENSQPHNIDTSASSKKHVDNPDDIQEIGQEVNATPADSPSAN